MTIPIVRAVDHQDDETLVSGASFRIDGARPLCLRWSPSADGPQESCDKAQGFVGLSPKINPKASNRPSSLTS